MTECEIDFLNKYTYFSRKARKNFMKLGKKIIQIFFAHNWSIKYFIEYYMYDKGN